MTADAGDDVGRRLAEVRGRIERAGGDVERVRIVAVTKGFGVESVVAAAAAGLVDIGENYADELVAKARATSDVAGVRWHFVGQLQRNKVRHVAPYVDLYQSVDRLRLGAELATRAAGARILVQVNLTDDPARGGVRPDEVAPLVGELGDLGLDVVGLMAVAPLGPLDLARDGFRTVRTLADRLALPERSYGMTDDLEIGVAEGATIVRLGTALFGPRPPR
jgi:pyridoxal phosphate enzyme (YggS family)